jgi:phosphoglycerate dehydrogenase-like enzyme
MKTTLESAPRAGSLLGSLASTRSTSHLPRLRAAVVVRPLHRDLVYPADELARAAQCVDVLNPEGELPPHLWPTVDIILGGWGMPVLDAAFLEAAPNVRAVFYAAGSVRGFMTDVAWSRGLTVTTAAQANSETTAEFCLSLVLFSLKHGWRFVLRPGEPHDHREMPGLYGSRIGLVSFGRVARRLASLLHHLPVEVVCWDPLQPPELLGEFGVTPCDLPTLFATSHVVSLHAPWLPETEKLIGGELLARMPRAATLINTSRGAVLDEDALIELLRRRPDLTAVLDVTRAEPLPADSPLRSLANVILTPHIAGACGPECRRLGALAVDELIRYVQGQPLQHALTREAAAVMA